jgi:hypothetical protein
MTSRSTSLSNTQGLQINLYKNGMLYSQPGYTTASGGTTVYSASCSDSVQCNTNDTLSIYISTNVATTSYPDTFQNRLSIQRIGD